MDFINTVIFVNVGFDLINEEYIYPDHFHNIYEMFYCYRGQLLQKIKDETIEMNPGDWLLIKEGDRHSLHIMPNQQAAYFVFHFFIDDPVVNLFLKQSQIIHITKKMAEISELPYIVEKIHEIIERNHRFNYVPKNVYEAFLPSGERISLEAKMLSAIGEYITLIENNSNQISEKMQKGSNPQYNIANRVAEILENNLYKPVSIIDISKKLRASRSLCTKAFKDQFGISPRKYVSIFKLKKAKELLVSTNYSIIEISEELGFSSVYHFSKQFKIWSGVSPNHFRKNR